MPTTPPTPPRRRPTARPVRVTGRTTVQPQVQQPPAQQQPEKESVRDRIRRFVSRAIIGLVVVLAVLLVLFVVVRHNQEPTVKTIPTPVPTQVMPAIPGANDEDSIVVATPKASPVAASFSTDPCSGANCDGADPVLTECALPEAGAYALPSKPVLASEGQLGRFTLFGNSLGCGGVYWASFTPASTVMRVEMQVVNGDGDYVVVSADGSQDPTLTPMIHSSGDNIHATIVVFDENGEEIARQEIRHIEDAGA